MASFLSLSWHIYSYIRKQHCPKTVEANNVSIFLTYYGRCDEFLILFIEDEDLRIATELQIAHFGRCPMQLFWRPHVNKIFQERSLRRKATLSDILGVHDVEALKINLQTNRQLPFQSAPIYHRVHLFAPPPGPHVPLIDLRLVFPDRVIFHFSDGPGKQIWRLHVTRDLKE